MNIQEIEVTIDEKGQVQIQVRGVNGLQCLELTRELEQALGGEIILREMTSDSIEGGQDIDDNLHVKG